MTIVADLDTPAKQWTNTFPFVCIASLMNEMHTLNFLWIYSESASLNFTILYINEDGNYGGCPAAVVNIWVIPYFFNKSLDEAPIISPMYKLGST